jgi:thiol-disulfide isomerase/thioredoxin
MVERLTWSPVPGTTEYSCAPAQAWNQRTCGLTAGWLTQGLDEASMGKASRTKVDSSRREKIAAQRAAARRAEQRRRILIASGSVVVVLAVVLAFVVIKLNSKPASDNSPNGPTGAALASVVSGVTSVPASTLDQVADGSGSVTAKPKTISGAALTANGKPEMLYMGAEYCPYCAAERWSMIVALSRFGTFSGLATVHSAAANGAGQAEPDPNTPTWTFVNAKYTSKYLTFTPVEMQTNIPDSSTGSYTTLQTPTKAQEALITKYDSTSGGAIPFVDFGNKYLITGASYDAGVLAGLSWATIASDLSNPSSPVAKAVDGTANYITAAICQMTGNQPASACTATVKSLESQI